MRILDLFCGSGLVRDGLERAGFEVWGVDLLQHRAYPGPFLLHDALTLDDRFLDAFDAIWASPPCLRDTIMKHAPGAKGDAHPDLITPTQKMLDRWATRTGRPFVIENVENCDLLRDPIILCGSMFGLGVTDGGQRFHLERHRKFETNWPLFAPCSCRHLKPVVGIYGAHARNRSAKFGGRGTRDPWTRPHAAIMADAMGLERPLTAKAIGQGIPPAYSEWVGVQLRRHITGQRKAA